MGRYVKENYNKIENEAYKTPKSYYNSFSNDSEKVFFFFP